MKKNMNIHYEPVQKHLTTCFDGVLEYDLNQMSSALLFISSSENKEMIKPMCSTSPKRAKT